MPPAASVRKSSVATDSNRRQSGRQARTSTSRPINYYARPYGSMTGPPDDAQEQDPPGFFPAITYFADAITALPKEVQRHVSLMKEVEAKVYGPTEALRSLSATILQMPTPPPRNPEPSTQGLLSFTASNSTTASLNGSVINGTAPNADGFSDVLENSQIDEQADLARRARFRDLRHLIGNMIVNLDEKNNVMAEANRVLAQQLSRMDSVMPHVENEISEEARLGSLSHWAYAENRVKKHAPPANDRVRRDVAATTNLAAAAAAVHDNDIAAARGQATRESKKSRNQHLDSDFDDKPANKRAAPAKARKEAADPKASGLGITNGTSAIAPAKRRKVEKATAPAMERSASGAGLLKNGKAGNANATPRSTPQAEPVKQRKKPGPAPGFVPVKKRNQALNSGANSPANASSPVLNAVLPDLSATRPTSSRARQNSSTSNLQYSLLAGGDKKTNSRTASVADGLHSGTNGNSNGEVHEIADNKTRAQEVDEDRMNVDLDPKHDRTQTLKNEDTTMSDAPAEQSTRGRASKTSTPLNAVMAEGGTSMLRTRSNRGINSRSNNDGDKNGGTTQSARPSQSQTPEAGAAGGAAAGGGNGDGQKKKQHHSHHRKSGSGAHILKQIASFNRSPDMDRHRSVPGEPTSDMDSDDEEQATQANNRNQVCEGTATGRRSAAIATRGSASASGSVSGENGGGRSSSRRSAPRTVASVSSAAAMAERSSGRTSGRTSRARGGDEQPRSAPHSRSRQRTPEIHEDPGLEADDDDDGHGEEELAEEEEEEEEPEAVAPPPVVATPTITPRAVQAQLQKQQQQQQQVVEDEEDDEEEEEEDPNEPKYCYCGQGSFGEMIACDNENCTMEWFHLQCTGLRNVPGDNVKWYCDVCKESMGHTGRGRKGRPGSRAAAAAGGH